MTQRDSPTRQRSFRWSSVVLDDLEARADEQGLNANALGERLVAEGLRTLRHPLIAFREDGTGRRRAGLVGTRLAVHQVVQTVRDSDGSLEEAGAYLGLTRAQLDAVAGYYAEHRDEVDADTADAQRFADAERERWERAQQAFA